MGNALKLFEDEEYESGVQLIASINSGSIDVVRETIEGTRQLCVHPSGSYSNPMDYDAMVHTMITYLSKPYSSIDGKTASALARERGHEDIAALIEQELTRLRHHAEAPTK